MKKRTIGIVLLVIAAIVYFNRATIMSALVVWGINSKIEKLAIDTELKQELRDQVPRLVTGFRKELFTESETKSLTRYFAAFKEDDTKRVLGGNSIDNDWARRTTHEIEEILKTHGL